MNRQWSRTHVTLGIMMLLGALTRFPVEAQEPTNVWLGTSGVDWFVDANWSLGHMPAAGEWVKIDPSSAGHVILTNATPWLSGLTLTNRTLTFSNNTTCLFATNIFIQDRGNITHFTMPTAQPGVTNRVYITCSNLTVEVGGKMDCSEKGWLMRYGYYYTNLYFNCWGASYGGRGVTTKWGVFGDTNLLTLPSKTYGVAEAPIFPGSGGGRNANPGGGVIRVVASGTITVNGMMAVNGGNGGANTSLDGASSGGSIWLTCYTLTGSTNGIIQADGGGTSAGAFGGGGGGRIALCYTNADFSALRVSADYGKGNVESTSYGNLLGWAEPGTLYLSNPTQILTSVIREFRGMLILSHTPVTNWVFTSSLVLSNALLGLPDGFVLQAQSLTAPTNGKLYLGRYGQLKITNDVILLGRSLIMGSSNTQFQVGAHLMISNSGVGLNGLSSLVLGGDLTLTQLAGLTVQSGSTNGLGRYYGSWVETPGSFLVANGCWVYPSSAESDGACPLFKARTLSVATNAGFNANYAGFVWIEGPGGTPPPRQWTDWGANHGGRGGGNTNALYGNEYRPIICGSGGGRIGSGGSGGGAFAIETSGDIQLQGAFKANGNMAITSWGAGSGGAIFILCGGQFSGPTNGVVEVKGGNGPGGAGGGGRIAVWNRTAPALVYDVLSRYDTNRCQRFASIPSFLGAMRATAGTSDLYGSSTTNATDGSAWFFYIPVQGTIFTVY